MCNKLQALGQQGHQNLVDHARDGNALERAVGRHNMLKSAGFALLDEFLAGTSFRLNDIG